MKTSKILIFFITAVLTGSFIYSQSLVKFSPKISIDVAGSHKVSTSGGNGTVDVNTGVTISGELCRNTGGVFDFGGGLSYVIPREQIVVGSGKFHFVPIYAIGKINLVKDKSIIPSLIVNLGYNIVYDGEDSYKGPMTLTGDIYYGGGLRVQFEKVLLEVIYKSYNGNASYRDVNFDLEYTTLSIGAGFLI